MLLDFASCDAASAEMRALKLGVRAVQLPVRLDGMTEDDQDGDLAGADLLRETTMRTRSQPRGLGIGRGTHHILGRAAGLSPEIVTVRDRAGC
jgi:hypothetical protein